MASCRFRRRGSKGVYSVATWRAVVTVDCTTKMSAPASWARAAKRSARWGIEDTTTLPPALLDRLDAALDELFLDGLSVDRLDDAGRLLLAGRHDPLDHLVGILVAGEDPLEVQDGQATESAHLDGQTRAHDPVHGGGDDGDVEAPPAQLPGDVDLVGIDGQGPGNQRDVIEAVRARAFRPRPTHMPIGRPSLVPPCSGHRSPDIGMYRLDATIFRGV